MFLLMNVKFSWSLLDNLYFAANLTPLSYILLLSKDLILSYVLHATLNLFVDSLDPCCQVPCLKMTLFSCCKSRKNIYIQ